MYIKLILRNAARSLTDYLLYLTTLAVLSSLMMFSNLLAQASSQNGLQASSVPLLIASVMASLLSYMNGYMLRRRAKEFATYMLLGMKKGRISAVFFGESFILGIVGLACGVAAGICAFLPALSILRAWFPIQGSIRDACVGAMRDCALYFLAIQALSLLSCVRKIKKLHVGALMSEGRKNQSLRTRARPFFWPSLCLCCVAVDAILILFITSGNDILMMIGLNTVVFSLVLGIWAFYQSVYHALSRVRQAHRSALYRGDRLYIAAQQLSKVASNITLNTVLCICLVLSALTFSVGTVLPRVPGAMLDREMGAWMSFAEICLSVVFIVIYFSILAVRQIIEARENAPAYRVMGCLGKTRRQRRKTVALEIHLKYAFPALMCLLLLLCFSGAINGYLGGFLPAPNLLLSALGWFGGCFLALYAGYAFVAYRMSVKYLEL